MMRYDGFMVCLSKNWDLTSDMEIHNCVPIKNSRKVEMGRRQFFFRIEPPRWLEKQWDCGWYSHLISMKSFSRGL